jgi:hypothetical protein
VFEGLLTFAKQISEKMIFTSGKLVTFRSGCQGYAPFVSVFIQPYKEFSGARQIAFFYRSAFSLVEAYCL